MTMDERLWGAQGVRPPDDVANYRRAAAAARNREENGIDLHDLAPEMLTDILPGWEAQPLLGKRIAVQEGWQFVNSGWELTINQSTPSVELKQPDGTSIRTNASHIRFKPQFGEVEFLSGSYVGLRLFPREGSLAFEARYASVKGTVPVDIATSTKVDLQRKV